MHDELGRKLGFVLNFEMISTEFSGIYILEAKLLKDV